MSSVFHMAEKPFQLMTAAAQRTIDRVPCGGEELAKRSLQLDPVISRLLDGFQHLLQLDTEAHADKAVRLGEGSHANRRTPKYP